jgi:anti-repressor protein
LITKEAIAFQLGDRFPVNFDDAWQWLGYSTKQKAKDCLIANFLQGEDFNLPVELGTLAVPRPAQKILLTTDCFKMWGMVAGTAQGKQVRLYFLECEKIAKQKQEAIPALPQTYLEALKALVAATEREEAALAQLEAAKPAIEFAEAIAVSDETIDFNEFAKLVGTGRTRLFREMRKAGVILQQSNLPYQKWMDAGYFEVTEIVGANGVNVYALVTGKGQLWLQQRLGIHGKNTTFVDQLDLLEE